MVVDFPYFPFPCPILTICSAPKTRKYEAITGAGIKVMKRVDLPNDFIKASLTGPAMWSWSCLVSWISP
jgi:hypothetical protein